MKVKEFVIIWVLTIFTLIFLSGLHFSIVTKGEETSGGWYDTCFNKFHVWFAW